MSYLEPQQGEICPTCNKKGRSGVLVLKSGMYGVFLACNQYPRCFYTTKKSKNLENQATQLLKTKKKKTRRGSGIQKKLRKQEEHRKLMEQYKKQKRERAQMFADFKRLIG